LQLEDLDIQDAPGLFQIIHRALIVRWANEAGKNSRAAL
jgi:hypothetical protein